MSKSLGNVIDPRVVMLGGKDAKKEPPYGADVLRLWVSSVDYSSDVLIGGRIIGQVRRRPGWRQQAAAAAATPTCPLAHRALLWGRVKSRVAGRGDTRACRAAPAARV